MQELCLPLLSVIDTSGLMKLLFDKGLGMMVESMKTPRTLGKC